jgi:Arc/MetJ family transcription regulator
MRTNIDIDPAKIAEFMKRKGIKTKREAIDRALDDALRLARQADIRQLRGIGWEGDLDKMRRDA